MLTATTTTTAHIITPRLTLIPSTLSNSTLTQTHQQQQQQQHHDPSSCQSWGIHLAPSSTLSIQIGAISISLPDAPIPPASDAFASSTSPSTTSPSSTTTTTSPSTQTTTSPSTQTTSPSLSTQTTTEEPSKDTAKDRLLRLIQHPLISICINPPSFEKKGYATEALKAILSYYFAPDSPYSSEQLIYALTPSTRDDAHKVLTRLGFQPSNLNTPFSSPKPAAGSIPRQPLSHPHPHHHQPHSFGSPIITSPPTSLPRTSPTTACTSNSLSRRRSHTSASASPTVPPLSPPPSSSLNGLALSIPESDSAFQLEESALMDMDTYLLEQFESEVEMEMEEEWVLYEMDRETFRELWVAEF
ncbi:hypothetical protein HDV05_006764 [Chytridiales sp. JEL 0842]|nr:hypothetical protein HDV05_006764 [Chytridiales sp. JEL 0842]